MNLKTKKPQSSRSGASDNALPSRPFKNNRRERSMQVDGLPELRTLDFELMILRALLTKPTRDLLFTKHYSLAKNRFTAFERVARASMRDGYTQADAARLLLSVHAECAGSGFHFNATCAAWVVASQCDTPNRWVIAPATNKRARIVGVSA